MTEVQKKGFRKDLIALIVVIVILAVSNIYTYTTLQNQITLLSNEKNNLQTQVNTLTNVIKESAITIKALNTTYQDYKSTHRFSDSEYISLKEVYDIYRSAHSHLDSDYDALLAQYNAIASSQSLYIGTTLETYYHYVRLNYLTVTGATMDEAKWHDYPNYYSISVKFAASLASHDIGNCYWSSLESGCNYYTYAGEYSYQTSSRIMQSAMSIAGISSSDSSVTKIQKVLAFVHSFVHYETKLLDHMWFPTETLTFRSGDCTSFSILASAMFEEVGIKSAVAFFTNSTLGGHAMVLVHLDDLGGYGYYYYRDLTSYGLTSGKWIMIEPQCASLDEQHSRWFAYWSIVACAEVPYGP